MTVSAGATAPSLVCNVKCIQSNLYWWSPLKNGHFCRGTYIHSCFNPSKLPIKVPRVTNINFLLHTINTCPREKVMSINKMITEGKMLWSLRQILPTILKGNIWRSVCMWILGLKGLTTIVEAVVERFDLKGLCVHHPQLNHYAIKVEFTCLSWTCYAVFHYQTGYQLVILNT